MAALSLLVGSACGGPYSEMGGSSSTPLRDVAGSRGECSGSVVCGAGGTLQWVRRIGGPGNSIAGGVAAADTEGGILVSGTATAEATFDSEKGAQRSEATNATMFLVEYDRHGAVEWIEQAVGHGPLAAPRIASATDGAAFMTGDFYPEATFQGRDGDADTRLVASDQAGGIFLVKYAAGGILSWAASASGPGGETGLGVAALANGGAAVAGFFGDSTTFGAGAAELAARGRNDAFVARYDADGNVAWAHAMGGPVRGDWAHAVTEVADGGIVVVGSFTGPLVADTGDEALIAGGSFDVFVIKYDRDGKPAWAARGGGSDPDVGRGVAALADGGVLVTGSFRGQAGFGLEGSDAVELVAAGDGGAEAGSMAPDDIFVLKLAADGAPDWAIRAGGEGNDIASAIATFPDGSFVIAGSFEGEATFGEGKSARVTLASAGRSDVFVARYDARGSLLWAERAGGPDLDGARAVAVIGDGTVAVTGVVHGSASFGKGARATRIESPDYDSIFLARFAP